jgi:hypothetical protein
MHSRTISGVVAVGAVLLASVLVFLLARPTSDELTLLLPAAAPAPAEPPLAIARADLEPAASLTETPAEVKARELEAMSETFRNTSFLIAIRDAGFVCNELLRVYGGLDGAAKWTATCSEMLAYTLSVAESGALRVDPMLQYFDGVQWPTRIEPDAGPIQVPSGRTLRDQLPPESR